MRKLASIQKITNLTPIENADNIVVVQILGWKVVVKKNEFNVGDLCVYCELDSVLPEKPEFEFLKQHNYKITTVKLRGQVSQGICFPLSILPDNIDIVEGLDVTEILNIKKYEPKIPTHLSGLQRGSFPSDISKTDEERIQTCFNDVFSQPNNWYITEKIDGSSITIYKRNLEDDFGICSRNIEFKLEDESNSYISTANKFGLLEKIKKTNNIAIQGELFGEGIQGNKYLLTDKQIKIFSVFDINSFSYFKLEQFLNMRNILQFETVPIISMYVKIPYNIDELVELSKGNSVINKNVKREGIVIRNIITGYSFKVINPDFLLKYKE